MLAAIVGGDASSSTTAVVAMDITRPMAIKEFALLTAIEQKASSAELKGLLLECPQDAEGIGQGAAQQLQTMLRERGIDLDSAFSVLDADGSGSVTHREFKDGLRELGIELPHAQMKELIATFDEDGDGDIDYSEFVREFTDGEDPLVDAWTLQSKLAVVDADIAEEDLNDAFGKLDYDGDGSITHDEFRAGLRRIGVVLPIGTVKELIRTFDADDDGMIEWQEFVHEFGTKPHQLQALLLAQGQKTEAREEILKRIWKQVDVDGSGALDRDEVRQVLILMGRSEDEIDLDAAMEEMDDDRSGEVDYQEFETWFVNRGVDLAATFAAMDVDGDGSLTHKEFRDGLRGLGINLPISQVEGLIATFDKDDDGEIDYNEFVREFQNNERTPEAAEALTLLQKKLDRRSQAQKGSRGVRILVGALQRDQGDPARLSRAELRLLFLIIASCVSKRSVHAVDSFGITQALVDTATEAAATLAADAEAGRTTDRVGMVFPRPMSVEALFAIAQVARFEETHERLMQGSLVTALLSLQQGMLFQAGDNVQGCIVPKVIGQIVCLLAANKANREQLIRENALHGLVAVLYTNPADGVTPPELQMWALRATGVDGAGGGAEYADNARGGLAYSADEVIAARLLPCALRLISSAPDPTVRRFAMSLISVASEDVRMLDELAAFQESQLDYATMSAVIEYSSGCSDVIGCREVARFLRNMVRKEDIKEKAAEALPVMAMLAWMGHHDEEMQLLAREALVIYCQTKASKYMVAQRRAKLVGALSASGLAIPAILGMAAFLIDSAQHQAEAIANAKAEEQQEQRARIQNVWNEVEQMKKRIEELHGSRPGNDEDHASVRVLALQGNIDEQVQQIEFQMSQKMAEASQMEEDVAKHEEKEEGLQDDAIRQKVLILFKKYDRDMGGTLDEKELALLLADLECTGVTRVGLGGNQVQEEYRGMVHDIMTEIDTDGGGEVEPDELIEWYRKREGVGELMLDQIEDAELARFCVSQLVHLVKRDGEEQAEKWSGMAAHGGDDVKEIALEDSIDTAETRKARWKNVMGKTKAALVVNDKKSSGRLTKREALVEETDEEKAARLMKSVLGRMQRSMLDITFMAWAEYAKFRAGRTIMRFRCLETSTVRSGKELTSPKVGELLAGTEVEGFETVTVRFGISRVRTKAGWVSDKFVDGRPILQRIDQDEKTVITVKPPDEPVMGTLIVKVIAARGLPKMDLFGSVDGYAVGAVGTQKHQTSVVKKDRDPVWNKTMEFTNVCIDDDFCLQVFDKDLADSDDCLGQVSRTIKAFTAKLSAFRTVNDIWYPIEHTPGGLDNPKGEVRIRCEFLSNANKDRQAFAGEGVEKTHFYLSTDPPPWPTMMQTIVPLLICNDMSVRTAMANLCRSMAQSPVVRKAFCDVEDSMYNLLTLYSTFHPPIKRDCAHALSILVREQPGMADRLYHKLKWSVVTPLLGVESPDTIIGATILLREVAANATPGIRQKLLRSMVFNMDLTVFERNIRRAQTTRIGGNEKINSDAPELALPTFTMLSEIIADHQESRMQWCRMDDAVRIMLWHAEKGPTRVRRAAATLCAQLATHVECQANLFERGADMLLYRFPHNVEEDGGDLYSNQVEKDKPTAIQLACCITRLACNSQNAEQWILQGGLQIIPRLLELKDASVDACVAGTLSYLATAGRLTVLVRGQRVLSKYARVALGPLGELCHSPYQDAKQQAVNAVWQLSKQLDDLSVLPEEGGLVTVFPMLYTSSQRIHAWASQHLLQVAQKQPELRDQYVHPSNYMCMLKCVRTTAVVETKKNLEDTIALVCNDHDRRQTAYSLGAYFTLQILGAYPEHLDWAVTELLELAQSTDPDGELARHVCARQGGFQVITFTIRSPEREDLCRSAAVAFALLSKTPALHSALLQAGAAMVAPAYAKYPSEEVRRDASTALLNLAKGDPDIRLGVEELTTLNELKSLLDSDDDQVVGAVVEALSKLTVSVHCQIRSVRAGMLGWLRRIVLSHPFTQEHAYNALRNLCRCSLGMLCAMGFSEPDAREALKSSADDVAKAVALLLKSWRAGSVSKSEDWTAILACRIGRDEHQQQWAVTCLHDLFGASKNFDLVTSLKNSHCMELTVYGFTEMDEEMQFDTMHAIGSLVGHCELTLALRAGGREGVVYPDAAAAAEAKTFLSNSPLMPHIESMLDRHTNYEDRIVLEVMSTLAYVSDCDTGFYTEAAEAVRAATRVFQVLQHSRNQAFLSARLERRQFTRQTTALRALASLCNQDVVRNEVVKVQPLVQLFELCADNNVQLRPAACSLLLNLGKSPAVQAELMTEKLFRRLVYLLRMTLGKSRGYVDKLVCVLAELPMHKGAMDDLKQRHLQVEKCEGSLAAYKRKIKEAKDDALRVRGAPREKADQKAAEVESHLPEYEDPWLDACAHVSAWHSQGQMFYFPDFILAVLRSPDVEKDTRVWWLNRFVVLINGDRKLDDWYTRRPRITRGAPPKTPGDAAGRFNIDTQLGSEKLDAETIRSLMQYGTDSSRSVQIKFLEMMLFWAKKQEYHGHMIAGDAVPVLAGLCDAEHSRTKDLAREILAILLKNFAVMRYFEGRADSHAMVVLASRILADNRDVQRWSSELLAHAPNPAKLTLQLLTDQDTGMAEELEALRAIGKVTDAVDVQLNIALRICKLCEANSKVRAQLIQEGGVEALFQVLVSPDPEVQMTALQACYAIGNDSVYRDRLLTKDPDVVGAICRMIVVSEFKEGHGKNTTFSVKNAAIEVLGALAFGDTIIREQYRKDISEMPIIVDPEDEAAVDDDPVPEEEPVEEQTAVDPLADGEELVPVELDKEQVEDARAEMSAELDRREADATRNCDFIVGKLLDAEGAWDLVRRSAKPHPARELAAGQLHARKFICSVAISEKGRQLLDEDDSMISLVVYIERGIRSELKYWCTTKLAMKAAAEDVQETAAIDDSEGDIDPRKFQRSNASSANAFPHLIDPIDGQDVPLRLQCLRALNCQLRDSYASKQCLHMPLLKKLENCANVHKDPATRELLAQLFVTLSRDKIYSMRFCRKGFFNTVASMCEKVSDEDDTAPGKLAPHQMGDEMVLRLLSTKDEPKEAAVHGVTIHAFNVALRLGDTDLKRWGGLSLVELSKEMLAQFKRAKKAKKMNAVASLKAIRGDSDGPVERYKGNPALDEQRLAERAFEFTKLVLPYVDSMDPDEWVQACCLEVLQLAVMTKYDKVLEYGPDLFRLTMRLMERQSSPVQIEACKLLDVLLNNGFTDFAGEGSGFTSMTLYSKPFKGFFGSEGIFDVDEMAQIPQTMQSWFGTRMLALEDQTGTEMPGDYADEIPGDYEPGSTWEFDDDMDDVANDSYGAQDRTSGQDEEVVRGSKVNPHQLLLAVTAPLLESLNTEARLAALRLMINLSVKFPQFRTRLYIYDVFPIVVRTALASGNERLFRHSVVAEERELGRRLVCILAADEAVRQSLLRGWKTAGVLLLVQSYETVMLGMADDEANLRKLRVWMVQSLLMCAETDEQSRQPIAAKALTVLLSMMNSSNAVIRHAALHCTTTVLKNDDDRHRTSFDGFMCRKELLRHLHLDPGVYSRAQDDLQQSVDCCILDLLRDCKYTKCPFDGDMRSLLVLARRGTLEEAQWIVMTLAEQMDTKLAEDAPKWGAYETRCIFDTLGAVVRTSDAVVNEKAALIYERILQHEDKQEYFLGNGGVLILAGVLMSPRPATKLAGIKALKVLIASDKSREKILFGRMITVLTAVLDVWYASSIWTIREKRPAPATANAKRLQKAAKKLGGIAMLAPKKPTSALEVRDAEAAQEPTATKAIRPAEAFAGGALQKRLQKAAKKAATLRVIPKAAAEARAADQTAIIEDTCAVLEQLLTCDATDCERDCIQSGILASLSRASLLVTTTPYREYSGHAARRTLADITSVKCWSTGDVMFADEIRSFPRPHPLFPPPTAKLPDKLILKELVFGKNFALGLTWCGQVYSRGQNDHGQLGQMGSVTECVKFTKVKSLRERVTNIACGESTCAAVTETTVYIWGSNAHGQAGRGFVSKREDVPRPAVLDGHRPFQVAVGTRHVSMIDYKGQLLTWGDGGLGQLGHGDIRPRLTPTLYSGANDFKQLVAGPNFNFAVTTAGQVMAWGDNSHGQLGFPRSHNGCLPAQIQALRGETVVTVAAGVQHVLALTATGTVYSWGDNRYGALGRECATGDPGQDYKPAPMFLCGLPQEPDRHNDEEAGPALEAVKLRSHEQAVRIACGDHHSVVLTDAGVGYSAGEGAHGQLGRMDRHSRSTPGAIVALMTTQHLTDVYCSPHGTVFMSVPMNERVELTARSYAAESYDEYLTDLRVLASIVPAAMFPTSSESIRVAKYASELTVLADELVALHNKLPHFPRLTHELEDAPTNQPEDADEIASYKRIAEVYAKYTETCNGFVKDCGSYLDVPRETHAKNQLWATYNRYDVFALGVLAQDFVSDWARSGANERALACEHISLTIAENLMGRERHSVLDALPVCCPRPAALFAVSVNRVLQQFGSSGNALPTSEQVEPGAYEGYQWRFRTDGVANVSLLNLLMAPLQRAELSLQELTDDRALLMLRSELKWVDATPIDRRPAFAELVLDMNFESLDKEFEKLCIADVAAGLDVPVERIAVVRLRAGSVKVMLLFFPGKGKKVPAAEFLADRLNVRSKDKSSMLYRGDITSKTISAIKVPAKGLPDDDIMKISKMTKKYRKEKKGLFSSFSSSRKSGKGKKGRRFRGRRKKEEEEEEEEEEGDGTPGGYAVSKLTKARLQSFHDREIKDKKASRGRTRASALLLMLTDSFGGRVIEFAEFKFSKCTKLCKQIPPPNWIPTALVVFPFAVLFLRLGMSDAPASAFNISVLLVLVPIAIILVSVLRRVRKHPTLTLPVSKDMVMRVVDYRWPNVLARTSLGVEFIQHNVIGLAVATEWSALPGLDSWLFWGGRGEAVQSGVYAVGAIGFWLICIQSILGRLSLERWPWLEALVCVVFPCVLSEMLHMPILIGLLGVVPCTGSGCMDTSTGVAVPVDMDPAKCEQYGNEWFHGRMLWEPAEVCWGVRHTAVSMLFVMLALLWAVSTALVPLQLYHVRHELQIRQQHWWRMILMLCKCATVAAVLAVTQHNGYPTWNAALPGIPGNCTGVDGGAFEQAQRSAAAGVLDETLCVDAGGEWMQAVLPQYATCTDGAGELTTIIDEDQCEVPAEQWPLSLGVACGCHAVLLLLSLRAGTLVAPRSYNLFRSFTFATAAWSSVCVWAMGFGSGRTLQDDGGGVFKLALIGWVALGVVFVAGAAFQRWRERSAVSPYLA